MGRRSLSSRLWSWLIEGFFTLLGFVIPFVLKLLGKALDLFPQRLLLVPLSFIAAFLLIQYGRSGEAFDSFPVEQIWYYVFPVAYTVNYFIKKVLRRGGRLRNSDVDVGTSGWKGSSASQQFYRSRSWQSVRYQFLKTVEKKCVLCGSVRGPFHVDHIKPRSRYPHLALNRNNLQLLCAPCNLGKGADDSGNTDFRKKRA